MGRDTMTARRTRVAMNLSEFGSGNLSDPFLNLFKQASGFAGNVTGGGRLTGNRMNVDAQGWPINFNIANPSGGTFDEIDAAVGVGNTNTPSGVYAFLYDKGNGSSWEFTDSLVKDTGGNGYNAAGGSDGN